MNFASFRSNDLKTHVRMQDFDTETLKTYDPFMQLFCYIKHNCLYGNKIFLRSNVTALCGFRCRILFVV